jgi:hypothetical protein
MEAVRSYPSIVIGLPRILGGSAPALRFSRPAQRLLTLRPACSPSRQATLYTGGSSSFVTSTTAPIATGWSEPVPGRVFIPLKNSAFSRRTSKLPLGPYSNQRRLLGTKGINTTYAALIQSAFQPQWWSSNQLVDANGNFVTTIVGGKTVVRTGAPSNTNEYSLMGYNFSFFWGIAIQLYESTLVANASRFDQFMDGNSAALNSLEQTGMGIFTGKGNCTKCHMGAEMTDAAVGNLSKANSGRPGNPVKGFHNLGVRPLSEILATGSAAPGAVTTATKTPGLRNIELTAPYMHNGGQLTLEQVAEFYGRGGDFGTRGGDVDSDLNSFGFSTDDVTALAAFLRSLTDQRTLHQSAPFDHPSLDIPNGATGDNLSVTQNGTSGIAVDDPITVLHISATGKDGSTLSFKPFSQELH